jgi:polyisoprenoid-binding protein YceI
MNYLLRVCFSLSTQKESNKELVEMAQKKWIQIPLLMVAVLLMAACTGAVETIEEAAPVDEASAVVVDEAPQEEDVPEEVPIAVGRTFRIVPDQSQASYSVDEEFLSGAITQLGKELGLFDTVGVTQEISGELVVEPDSLEIVSGEFVVDISSLTSDDSRRDRAIRTRFLQLDTYPLAVFSPQSIEGVPDNYQEGDEVSVELSGEMAMRDSIHPITFDMIAIFQNGIISGTAEATLLLTDYGFDPPVMGDLFVVGDEVRISLSFTAEEIFP